MVTSALFSFLHFAAALAVAATLFFEWLTLSRTPTLDDARRLQVADRWYGIAAGVLLIVGFVRVFQFEKGSSYYFHNTFFLLKIGAVRRRRADLDLPDGAIHRLGQADPPGPGAAAGRTRVQAASPGARRRVAAAARHRAVRVADGQGPGCLSARRSQVAPPCPAGRGSQTPARSGCIVGAARRVRTSAGASRKSETAVERQHPRPRRVRKGLIRCFASVRSTTWCCA